MCVHVCLHVYLSKAFVYLSLVPSYRNTQRHTHKHCISMAFNFWRTKTLPYGTYGYRRHRFWRTKTLTYSVPMDTVGIDFGGLKHCHTVRMDTVGIDFGRLKHCHTVRIDTVGIDFGGHNFRNVEVAGHTHFICCTTSSHCARHHHAHHDGHTKDREPCSWKPW